MTFHPKPKQTDIELGIRDRLKHGDIENMADLLGKDQSTISKRFNPNEPLHKSDIYCGTVELWAMSLTNPKAALETIEDLRARVMLWCGIDAAPNFGEMAIDLADEALDVVRVTNAGESSRRIRKEVNEVMGKATKILASLPDEPSFEQQAMERSN